MFIKLEANIMPFEATPYIFYTTDIIYMVAVLSPEMGFTLTLSVCACVSVFMSPMHAAIHLSIHSTIYLSFHLCTQLTLSTSIHPTIYFSI